MKVSLYLLLIICAAAGCMGNSPKKQSAVVTPTTAVKPPSPQNAAKKPPSPSPNVKGMQLYEYRNDTLVQRVYIKPLPAHRISFVLQTTHRETGNTCHFADTARCPYPNQDPEMYEDEQAEDEPYPAREYLYDKNGNWISIGIEEPRPNRLRVAIADASVARFKGCHYESVGTLRRKR